MPYPKSTLLYFLKHCLRVAVATAVAYYTFRVLTQILTRGSHYVFPDQLFWLLFLSVVVFQWKRAKLFLIDWGPFFLFVTLYDMMRSFAPSLYREVHIVEPYLWELQWFGWLTGGEVPTFWLQHWRKVVVHGENPSLLWIDFILALAYIAHFIAPAILMAILWWKRKDRRRFWEFSCTLNVLNYMALATFYLYPAAPPWYYDRFGATPPSQTPLGAVASGGLLHLDRVLKMGFFTTLWGAYNPNYFAAIPSLHAAWPFTIALFAVHTFGRKALPVFIYPALVAVAGMYFNHHYIVDYLVGWWYVTIAWSITQRWIMPKICDRFIDYSKLPKSFSDRATTGPASPTPV
jgi:hypothetical protein